jgi:hypothetical protein
MSSNCLFALWKVLGFACGIQDSSLNAFALRSLIWRGGFAQGLDLGSLGCYLISLLALEKLEGLRYLWPGASFHASAEAL